MNSYQVNNHQCLLQVYSTNEDMAQTTILFLHGGPGSGAKAVMDLPAFDSLSKNFHCLHFDQRGSGLSHYDLSQNLSIDDITSDVLAVVLDAKQRWNINHFFLWGGSFGGYLACLCLEKFPDQFQGVILSSPAITFERQQSLHFYQAMKSQYQKRMPPAMQSSTTIADDLSPEEFFKIKEVRDFIFSSYNPSNSLRHICAMSSWFYSHFMDTLFDKVHIPLLIMQGKDDPICHYRYLDDVVSHHQNISYHLYQDCGHEVFTDKQQEFVNTIKEFIKK